MNNYDIKQEASTAAGSAMMTQAGLGLVGALLIAQLTVGKNPEPNVSSLKHPQVRIEENSKTFGPYTNLFIEHKHLSFGFEETVASFYERFLAMQEPLGKEFEQVLYDNLWNLIVRT